MTFSFFELLDLSGTLAFAISGALAGREKRFDLFGISILAFATAIGGGATRDIMIGATPVMWLKNMSYFYTILLGVLMALVFFKKLLFLRYSLFLFDTIGLAVFTLTGIEKGMNIGLHPVICITLGTITASFGGVIRDILAHQTPVIFRREIYATACIAGGALYYLLRYFQLPQNIIYIGTTGIILLIRLLAVTYKWQLPRPHSVPRHTFKKRKK